MPITNGHCFNSSFDNNYLQNYISSSNLSPNSLFFFCEPIKVWWNIQYFKIIIKHKLWSTNPLKGHQEIAGDRRCFPFDREPASCCGAGKGSLDIGGIVTYCAEYIPQHPKILDGFRHQSNCTIDQVGWQWSERV